MIKETSIPTTAAAPDQIEPAKLRCTECSWQGLQGDVLTAWEPGTGTGLLDLYVYRTRADRTVAVDHLVGNAYWWVGSVCATLAPDAVRGFLLQGCTVPTAGPVADQ